MLGKHIQRKGINTLLVDDDKSLFGALAHLFLELDNLLYASVQEAAFRLDELFTLFCGAVEKSRVDFAGEGTCVFCCFFLLL